MTILCYSQRLLNPFRGSMCCIQYRSAEAVTADGIKWDIYVSNDFGYNLGGGIMGFFTDVLGARGEYRYFRRFESDNSGRVFNFSRATIGIVLRF